MPELPEVETTIKGLKPILNSTIINIKIHTPKLRYLIPKNITMLKKDIKIINIKRIGKCIIMCLSNNCAIILHLGMSGRLQLVNKTKFYKKKHDHFILETNKKYLLVLNDPRKFGFIDYDKLENVYLKKYILNLGCDALSSKLTDVYLASKISKKLVPIKQILLDQRIISGIGNIYASEILFNAGISPFSQGMKFNLKDCKIIIISIKKILKKAIKEGGSSLRDYVATDGTLGNFQNKFKVYGKSGKKISGKLIKKTVQYGRATYYCPDLQKKL